MNIKKKPAFNRYLSENLKKLGTSWRKPRGRHSKVRLGKSGKPKRPRIGYGAPVLMKHLDSKTKLLPKLIKNVKDLESLNTEKEVPVISTSVGMKKKIEIASVAEEKGISIYNLKDAQAYIENVKKHFEEKKKASEELKKSKEAKQAKAEKKSEKKEEKPKEELSDKLEDDKKKVLIKGQ